MARDLVSAALINAAESCDRVLNGTMFHSDQGSQHASDEFRKLLSLFGLKQSMSRRGRCWDNAPIESFFISLNEECEQLPCRTTLLEAQTVLCDYIEIFSNRERLHSAIGYKAHYCYKETRGANTLNWLSIFLRRRSNLAQNTKKNSLNSHENRLTCRFINRLILRSRKTKRRLVPSWYLRPKKEYPQSSEI